LAKEFNGGGHTCAAGFNVNGTWDDLYPSLVETINRHLELVNKGELS